MRKWNSAIRFMVLAVTMAACSSDPVESASTVGKPDPESEAIRNGVFSPDPFRPESEADSDGLAGDPGAADMLAKVELANGGSVTFLNEAPSREIPSISVVAVERSGSSVMDLIGKNGASSLELFLAIAPVGTPAPEALKVEHEARHLERGLSLEPRPLSLTTLVPYVVVDDDPSDCLIEANWTSSFNAWSIAAAGRQHVGYVEPEPDANTYAYFGTYDQIWAGVCMYKFGSTINFVEMQRWNGSLYVTIPGSYENVPLKSRYRYYSYSPGTATRRIMVHDSGSEYTKFFLSGAWAETVIAP